MKKKYEKTVIEEKEPETAQEAYDVLISFTDDDGAVYWAGHDKYPAPGVKPRKDRIKFLQSTMNRYGSPIISSAEK